MSRAVLPTLYVGIAFGYDETDPNPVFTDVSAMVLPGWDCRAGRDHESDRVRVGTLTLTFRDPDGRFNPLNAASPYWPNVRPMVPIRVTETVGGTTYPVFRGFVERWPPLWAMHGRYGTVTVTAVDPLAILAGTDLRNPLDTETFDDLPTWLYPLNEPQEARQGADAVAPGVNPLIVVRDSAGGPGTLAWGAATTLSEAPTGVSLDYATGSYAASLLQAAGDVPSVSAGGPWSVEVWFRIEPGATAGPALMFLTDSPGWNNYIYVYLNSTDQPIAYVLSGVAGVGTGKEATSVTAANPITRSAWHHAVATLSADGLTLSLLVDGQSAGTATAAAPIVLLPLVLGQFGGYLNPSGYASGQMRGSLARLAQYPTALSAARVLAHYRAGTQSFYGDTFGARANRLLDYAGWAGARSVDAGSSQMLGATGLDGTDGLTALLDNATNEGGVFYADRAGAMVAEGRGARYLRTTPTLTLGDGAGEIPYQQGIAPDYDNTYVYTDVRASRPYGITATVGVDDGLPVKRRFRRTLDLTLRITSDLQTQDAARFALLRYRDPHMRIGLVTVQLATLLQADVQRMLGLGLGSRVKVAVRPVGQPGFTADFFVESIARKTQTNSAQVELVLSPTFLNVLILDDPVYGRTDADNVLAY